MSCIKETLYSVAEGFSDCSGIELSMLHEDFGRMLRARIRVCISLTVGVGFVPRKTQAKSAQGPEKNGRSLVGYWLLLLGT